MISVNRKCRELCIKVEDASNHGLGLDDGKKRFADTVLAASKAFALCCTLDGALVHRDKLAFLQAVKAALTKHVGTDKKLNDEQKEHAPRQIISRAVVSDEVIDIFTADIPDFIYLT